MDARPPTEIQAASAVSIQATAIADIEGIGAAQRRQPGDYVSKPSAPELPGDTGPQAATVALVLDDEPIDDGTQEPPNWGLLKRWAIIQAVFTLMMLLAVLGLAAVSVHNAKVLVVKGNMWVSRTTGQPVLMYNGDFTVAASGVLVGLNSSNPRNFRKAGNNSAKIMTTSDATLPYVTVSGGDGTAAGSRRTLWEELTYTPGDGPNEAAAAAPSTTGLEENPTVIAHDALPRPLYDQTSRRRSLQQSVSSTGNNSTNSSSSAPSDVPQDSVPIRTATTSTAMGLHSGLPMSVLKELKYLQVNASSGAQLNLMVLAVIKMPTPFEEGLYMSCEVLKIVTYIGTITVHGSLLEFGHDNVSAIFKEAGFLVTGTRRRQTLAGAYDLIGFFNFIKDLEIQNLPVGEPKPQIASNFQMKIRVYDPCLSQQDPTADKCRGPDGMALPGTVLDGAARFMTTYVSVSRQKQYTLMTTELPNFGPELVRKELVDDDTGYIYEWQDLMQGTRVTHCKATKATAEEFSVFHTLTKDSIVSFSFLGYGMKLGVAARRFRLTTRQAAVARNGNSAFKVVDIDYWDTSDNGDLCSISRNTYPVAFEMDDPEAGLTKIHIVSFRAGMVLPSSTFDLPESFSDTNDPKGCPGPRFTKVPLVSSPYDPVWKAPPKDQLDSLFSLTTDITVSNSNPDIGRGVVAAVDDADDKALRKKNQTGTTSGRRAIIAATTAASAHPVSSLRPGEVLVPLDEFERIMSNIFSSWGGNGNDSVTVWPPGKNGRYLMSHSFGKAIGPCEFAYKTDEAHTSKEISVGCSAPIPEFPPISINGNAYVRLTYAPQFSIKVEGCLGAYIGFTAVLRQAGVPSSAISLVSKAGLAIDIKLLGICLSYDTAEHVGVLSATSSIPSALFAHSEWELTFKTNFRECIILSTAAFRVKVRLNFIFVKVTKTIVNTALVRDRKCPASNPQSGDSRFAQIRGANNKCVTIPSGPQYNGERLTIADCSNDTDAQVFELPYEDKQHFLIKSSGGKVIEAQQADAPEGAEVQMWDFIAKHGNQLWRTEPADGSFFMIQNRMTSWCMATSSDGSGLRMATCDKSNAAMQFVLQDR